MTAPGTAPGTGLGTGPGPAYVAETYAGDVGTAVLLGGTLTNSPRLALRWLTGRARRMARALAPDPCAATWCPPGALRPTGHRHARDAPARLLAWAESVQEHEEVLRHLVTGRAYRFVAQDDDGCWYGLRARPGTPPARFPPEAAALCRDLACRSPAG
ncbi:hypothetical protein AB0J21_18665 [Streptomyces sp. NPDC049954]|uniref:hypothetical protein n=1 Tax=Streptomyces sp. NPDC049954 TaxID=3155779 RepID=UPI00342E2421